jgi:Rap1a immunity proteins
MLPDRLIAIASAAINLAIAVPCMAQDPQMAGYITGDRLITACDSRSERDSALCRGYILGVADAMQASKASGGALIFGWRACLPPETTSQGLRYVAVHFLIAQSSASGLVAKALSEAYPCPPGTRKPYRSRVPPASRCLW